VTYLRVSHKGAAALAPENTIASLAAALEHRVDMVEFDVIDAPDGSLVLAHSHEEVAPGTTTLDEALEFLAREAPPELALDLDLKWHGFERAVAERLRHFGLVERTIACSFFPLSLRELRRCEPALRTGISYPWDRRGLATRRALKPLVWSGAAALRRALPHRIGAMLRRAEASAAMIHFSVVSRATVDRCHALGVPLFCWTVDEPALLARVLAMGVDGVISNDPRIFHPDGEQGYDPCA
jgi:glycerophosphoryl diester phosphodiesterase